MTGLTTRALLAKQTGGDNEMSVWDDKIPKTKDKYVGIEIEFKAGGSREEYDYDKDNCDDSHYDEHTIHNDIGHALGEAGLSSYCCLGWDCDSTQELRVLVKQDEVSKVIPKICKILANHGAKADEGCGLHVHLDMRNRDVRLSYKRLYKVQDVLYKLSDPGRLATGWCERNNSIDFDASKGSRFKCINVEAYDDLETLEVRVHEGTVKAEEIVNWVSFLAKVVDSPVKNYRPIKRPVTVTKQLRFGKKLRAYVKQKLKKIA